MAKLGKSDVALRVASKLGMSRAQADAALNAVLETVRDGVQSGNDVVLTGFGTFRLRNVRQRRVRAIRGGGSFVTIPAHKRVSFTAGTGLKPK